MKSKFNKPDTVYPHGSLREQPEVTERKFSLQDLLDCYKAGEAAADFDRKRKQRGLLKSTYFKTKFDVPQEGDKLLAVPIVAQETEDELWEKVWEVQRNQFFPSALIELKSKFTIKRKTS